MHARPLRVLTAAEAGEERERLVMKVAHLCVVGRTEDREKDERRE